MVSRYGVIMMSYIEIKTSAVSNGEYDRIKLAIGAKLEKKFPCEVIIVFIQIKLYHLIPT